MAWAKMSNKKGGISVKRRNQNSFEMGEILICIGEKRSC